MRGQFFDFRNALAIAYLAPRRHRQQGMLAFTRVQFFPSYASGPAHTPRVVQYGLGSAVRSRAGSARAGSSSRHARPVWLSGCLAVWLSCTSGTSGTSGVSDRERKPLDLILWLPFRGLSAHRDSRLAPCKTPHPVLFGPVLFCPVLPCPASPLDNAVVCSSPRSPPFLPLRRPRFLLPWHAALIVAGLPPCPSSRIPRLLESVICLGWYSSAHSLAFCHPRAATLPT
jgi:hypothetical protein